MSPIRKVLIANRGEIACRIMRTARARGVRTVAVYSDADAKALHVRRADEAVRIGGAAPSESYLRIDAIIDAAKRTGAGAIHPGYGFLAERAEFAEACEKAGILFIGPPAAAIAAMGDKAEAKRRMIAAGVPCVPGYQDEDQSETRLAKEAARIGFPVMVKASAGGGGRGMRLVHDKKELAVAIKSARKEAENAFGDGRLVLERVIAGARHVEIQIMADAHGSVVHLGERDCSLQRRRQKVIEEAPSPVVTPEIRAAMGAAAVEAARAVGYRSAGTVEFLFDPATKDFFFLEMNTRIQVEHPVTEMVTGLDLVAMQFDVAEGMKLAIAQADVRLDGWAIEARLYAEDPSKGFLPQTGRIALFDVPVFSPLPLTGVGPGVRGNESSLSTAALTPNPSLAGGRGGHAECAAASIPNPSVRVDTGVEAGDEISAHYDPMIAKLIAHGQTRDEAREKLAVALEQTLLLGVTTNAPFLIALLRDETFANGAADTGYIEGNLARLAPPPPPVTALEIALVAAALAEAPFGGLLSGWNSRGPTAFPLKLQCGDETISARASIDGRWVAATLDGATETVEVLEAAPAAIRYRCNGVVGTAPLVRAGDIVDVKVGPVARRFIDLTFAPAAATGAAGDEVRAPMAGVVTGVAVKAGESVKKGQTLATIEAMKMEHRLAAPRDGVVDQIAVAAGAQVAIRTVLVSLRAGAQTEAGG